MEMCARVLSLTYTYLTSLPRLATCISVKLNLYSYSTFDTLLGPHSSLEGFLVYLFIPLYIDSTLRIFNP